MEKSEASHLIPGFHYVAALYERRHFFGGRRPPLQSYLPLGSALVPA